MPNDFYDGLKSEVDSEIMNNNEVHVASKCKRPNRLFSAE